MNSSRLRGSRRNAASIRARAPQRAQRRRGESGQFGCCSISRNALQDRAGLVLEQVLVAHFEQFVARLRKRSLIGCAVIAPCRGKMRCTQVLQQDGVELAHRLAVR